MKKVIGVLLAVGVLTGCGDGERADDALDRVGDDLACDFVRDIDASDDSETLARFVDVIAATASSEDFKADARGASEAVRSGGDAEEAVGPLRDRCD